MDSKKINTLIFIIFLCAVVIGLQLNQFREGRLNVVESSSGSLMKPAQEFFSGIGRRISGFWQFLSQGSQLEQQNRELQSQVAALKEKEELYTRTEEENKELRRLLDITRNEQEMVIAAEVIARDPDNWFRTLKVNKGKKDGVEVDMVVFSAEGLVGRVISTSDSVSNIRLIFNEKSAVPAQLVPSGELGVVYGEGKNTCIMRFINAEAEIKIGDQVVTSNLSQIYPPGKSIGTVSKIYGRDQLLYQAVQIKPSVQFSNLQFVLLIKRK